MLKEIYNDYGVQIIADGESYFARYDGGGVAGTVREIPITYEEAQVLMDLKDVYRVAHYIRVSCYDRWMHDKPVFDDIGNPMKLFMGRD